MTFLDVAPRLSRVAWRHALAERAALHGWRVHALGTDWEADMVVIRRPRIIWIFAEAARGRPSAPRLAAFVELRACRQEAVVWRPSDVEKVTRTFA